MKCKELILLIACAFVPSGAAAGQIVGGGQVIGGQTMVQGPPRDRGPMKTGTAAIRGRVFAADTGRPLRRARISVASPDLGPDPRTTSTNPDGKFEIKDLPAGRFTLTVSRNGYLPLRYGQRRPLEQGKPLQLIDRQVLENIDFSLPRMSLITGRVLDEVNEPISGVMVMAMRSVYFEGKRRLVPAGGGPGAQTDDAGQFRILGLVPGTYYVQASSRETWTTSEDGVEQTMGYAPTYFPGTTGAGDAKRVTVGVGQEAGNTDFALVPGRAAKVSGTALDSQGRPLTGQNVQLNQEYRGPNNQMMFSNKGATVAADGTFTIKDVTPGEYRLIVRGGTDRGQETAAMPIVVNGVDLDTVTLMGSSGWSASGVVTTETGAPPNAPRERVRVLGRAMQPELDPRIGGSPDSGRVKEDWTFTVTSLFGPVLIRPNLPDNWVVKAILHDGRDITDVPIEMKSGEELGRVQVVISDRQTSLTGQLTDEKGAPTADGTVIVFAPETDKWIENSRFVRSARPDQQGQYQIKGLPPGEYLAVAVDYVQEGMWNDPEYLESIRRYAQRVSLSSDSAAQAIALKLVSPSAG